MTLDSTINFDVEWGYRPETQLALKWHELSGGKFVASDRGTSNDKYFANIIASGTIAQVQALEDHLNTNKNQVLTMDADGGEEIFGAEVDHSSSLSVVMVEKGNLNRIDFTNATLRLKFFLNQSPTLVADTATLANIEYAYQYRTDRDYHLNPLYHQVGNTVDLQYRNYDTPIFEISLRLLHQQQQEVRKYITQTARGTAITWPSVTFDVFPTDYSEPHTVRIVDWEDGGRENTEFWNLRIKLIREPS
jgi:hypothetical protein